MAGAYLFNTAVKFAIRRPRPAASRSPAARRAPRPSSSFPSAHATSGFAAARAFSDAGAPAVPLYLLASALAASRVYLGVHYPSDVLAGAVLGGAIGSLPRARRRRAAAMRIGIVGMPNAGKSSLFNALTAAGAEAANYPFTTIEPNVAVVAVADERLDRVAELLRASEIVYDTISFHDIAGLVAGAHRGEGLGNRFLANIRETDAILHVVRAHSDANVVHPEGRVDPLADIETIETELMLADLEQAERRLGRVTRVARGGDRAAIAELAWLERLVEALPPGARRAPSPRPRRPPTRSARSGRSPPSRCSSSPTSMRESTRFPAAIAAHAAAQGAGAVAISARLEAELGELDEEEASAMRGELGVGEAGLARVVRGAFSLLDLIAFFTVGEAKPAQSWHLRRGLSAWHAAGEIHSDIQQGFVRAEVIGWQELSRRGAMRARASAACCASRGATTRCATAT